MRGPSPALFQGEPPEWAPDAPHHAPARPGGELKPTEVPQKTPLLGTLRHHGPPHVLASLPSALCLPYGICSREGAQACGGNGTRAPDPAQELPPRKPSGPPRNLPEAQPLPRLAQHCRLWCPVGGLPECPAPCQGPSAGGVARGAPGRTHPQGAGHDRVQQQQAVQRARAQLPPVQAQAPVQGLRHRDTATCRIRESRQMGKTSLPMRKTVSSVFGS